MEFDFAAEMRDAQIQPRRRRPARHHHREARHRALPAGAAERAASIRAESFLPPGDYKLKFLARENETGRIGTFEDELKLPGERPTACS